jgi:murein DD-endopeptidase MepM/ murein hydrolase activator NlpD
MKLKVLYSALIILILSSCASTSNYTVNLNDSTLSQGGLTLFHIDNLKAKDELTASFTGGEIFIVKDETGTWGIIATDLEAEPGSYELSFKGGKTMVDSAVEVIGEDYGSESLNLPSGMVTLSSAAIDRAIRERELIKDIWSKSNEEPLWDGPFIMPLTGRLSANFGVRRTMNNKAKAPHSGMDIAAPRGTPVLAANSGKVVFTGDFYFNGRFVVIDHGVGVFTIYAHLNKIMAKEGDVIKKGDTIGKVGSTGRATGPHLHFGVKVGSVRVSPLALFEILSNS